MTVSVRRIESRDEPRWRELFDGYTRFYEREPSEAITRHTWARIMDTTAPVHAIVAEKSGSLPSVRPKSSGRGSGGPGTRIAGFANYLTHESTLTLTPVCYLQDLFVDPAIRGGGIGRAMIDWLVGEMKAQGWSRLYWTTRENNYRARGLYDKYTPHSGFLRYVLDNAERRK